MPGGHPGARWGHRGRPRPCPRTRTPKNRSKGTSQGQNGSDGSDAVSALDQLSWCRAPPCRTRESGYHQYALAPVEAILEKAAYPRLVHAH